MKDDPTPEDARLAISHAKRIIEEFGSSSNVSQFMDEAREVYSKTLKHNQEKYSSVNIANDTTDEIKPAVY